MRYPGNIVTLIDTRPSAGALHRPRKCFYCNGVLEGPHDADCVVIHRPVVVRMTATLVVKRPRSWDGEQIEHQMNEGSWCSSNILVELERMKSDDGCLCGHTEFSYVRDATDQEALAARLLFDVDEDNIDPEEIREEAMREAAPDLYAALESLRQAVKAHPEMQGREYIDLGIQVNGALAKARGEAE